MTVTSIDTQSSDWASQLLETVRNRNNGKSDDLADKLMGDLDTDGDSVLSLEESGLSESAFSAADTDGDGKVSAQELAEGLKAEREKMTAEGEEVAGAGGAGGATASNANADTVLQSLLQNASQAAGVNPMDLRKALQAYGSNLLTSALGQYDGDLGVSFSDYMSSGQMSLLNFVGAESVDYTV